MTFAVGVADEVCSSVDGAEVVERRVDKVLEVATDDVGGWEVTVAGHSTGYLLISQFVSHIAVKLHPELSVLLYITSPGENKVSGVPDTWQKHGVVLLKVVPSVEPDTLEKVEVTIGLEEGEGI